MRCVLLRCRTAVSAETAGGGIRSRAVSGGALDRAQGTGAAHRARTPAQGDRARLRHLLDAQRGEDGEQGLELVRRAGRSEEHTSELQSRQYLVCRLLLEKKKNKE